MKKTEIAYLAGLIDGEACVSLEKKSKRHNGLRPVIEIAMTCEKTIKYIHSITKRGTVRPKKVSRKHYKPVWRWSVRYNDARFIASMVLPFLITKKFEATNLISHVPLKSGRHRKQIAN